MEAQKQHSLQCFSPIQDFGFVYSNSSVPSLRSEDYPELNLVFEGDFEDAFGIGSVQKFTHAIAMIWERDRPIISFSVEEWRTFINLMCDVPPYWIYHCEL
ncbi:hypothetical protein HHI36_024042 [Cryptolaemus montrouzieri]|uniref:Uncharacterized protein n=1 Tax=Cryptolaemus montrouzieri TaxID=559131 RepID=A0ABD2MV92_9CUCU